MQPVVRRHATDANMPAAQNFLPNERDHDSVINIVVGGVAGCDIFKRKLCEKGDNARIAGLHHPVCSFVHRPKFANERFDDDQRWIEHRIGRRIFAEMPMKAYSNCTPYSI